MLCILCIRDNYNNFPALLLYYNVNVIHLCPQLSTDQLMSLKVNKTNKNQFSYSDDKVGSVLFSNWQVYISFQYRNGVEMYVEVSHCWPQVHYLLICFLSKMQKMKNWRWKYFAHNNLRFWFLRFWRCEKWSQTSRLDPRHQRYKVGPKMGPSAHCRVPLRKLTSGKIFHSLTDGLWVVWQRSISHGYIPSKLEVNLCPSLYSLTEVIPQLTMISLSVRGYFITRIFAGLCIILREINHPLTDGLIIISWRMTSARLYNERRRLTSRLLGT